MAKDPKQAINAFTKKISQLIQDAASPAVLNSVGLEAVTIIKRRTRLGYGVSGAGEDRQRLKALSPAYIAVRKRDGSLSEFTSPGRSNLTRTGQMLDSMRVIRAQQGKVIIGPTGRRRGGGPTNEQVAGYVSDAGRPFLNLTRLDEQQLIRFYRQRFGDLKRRRF